MATTCAALSGSRNGWGSSEIAPRTDARSASSLICTHILPARLGEACDGLPLSLNELLPRMSDDELEATIVDLRRLIEQQASAKSGAETLA